MASTYLPILVDDDTGTPTAPNYDGTPLDSDFFADLEAILNEFISRPSKVLGGLWTWETGGSHGFVGDVVGANSLTVRNTNSGTSYGQLVMMGSGPSYTTLQHFGTGYPVSGLLGPSMGRLSCTTSMLIDATTQLSLASAGTVRARLTNNNNDVMTMGGTSGLASVISSTSGFSSSYNGVTIASNITTMESGVANTRGTQYNAAFPSWAIDIGGSWGGDGPNWLSDSFAVLRRSGGGNWARMMQLFNVGNAQYLHVGGGAFGVAGTADLATGLASPVSAQLLFGGDGSGWQLRIGRNNGGIGTHYWLFDDSGHFRPVGHAVSNIGSSGGNSIGTIFAINGEFGGNIGVTGSVFTAAVHPNGASGTGTIGGSSSKWGALYVVDANFGDVSFDNGWSITEGEKVGLGEGLAFVDHDNNLQMYLNRRGELYARAYHHLSFIEGKYIRKTKEERLA